MIVHYSYKEHPNSNIHDIGNEKYPNWKLVMRKFKIRNEKYPNWKSVMRKLKIGNGK
jgi:hypothetical protein